MGLDITAYEKIELVEAITLDEMRARGWDHPLYETDDHIFVYVDFERARDRCPTEGIYRIIGDTYGFRAGSYGGYNRWREQLAELVGTTPERVWAGEAPPAFGELIDFSDCEGTLDSKTCAKLASDFAVWQERAEVFAECIDGGSYWLARYGDWRTAFELAAGGGAVGFS